MGHTRELISAYRDHCSREGKAATQLDFLASELYKSVMTDQSACRELSDIELIVLRSNNGHYNEQDVAHYRKLRSEICESEGQLICYYRHDIVAVSQKIYVLFSFSVGVCSGDMQFSHGSDEITVAIEPEWNMMFEDGIEDGEITKAFISEEGLSEIQMTVLGTDHNEFGRYHLHGMAYGFATEAQSASEGLLIGEGAIRDFFTLCQHQYSEQIKYALESYENFTKRQKFTVIK